VVTDPVEELRALELHERLRLRRRVTFEPGEGRTPAEDLLLSGSAVGAQALGWPCEIEGSATTWGPSTVLDRTHPALEGVPSEALPDALVFSGGAGCVVGIEG
jgi:hypothetical protein